MDILKLIKNRKTIRKYKDKKIPDGKIRKIVEAGIWGPSLMAPGFQPWKFNVITNKRIIRKISKIITLRADSAGAGVNIILRISAKSIANSQMLILVYNSSPISSIAARINDETYIRISKNAEICAISAAVQNMILTAEALGIGCCWYDAPLFCKEEIGLYLKEKKDLVAGVSFGYPAEKGRRSPRKDTKETLKYLR